MENQFSNLSSLKFEIFFAGFFTKLQVSIDPKHNHLLLNIKFKGRQSVIAHDAYQDPFTFFRIGIKEIWELENKGGKFYLFIKNENYNHASSGVTTLGEPIEGWDAIRIVRYKKKEGWHAFGDSSNIVQEKLNRQTHPWLLIKKVDC
jgi:hypothetical protein